MKKRILKIGALALCIIMCLCSIVSVSAAWEPLAPADSCVSNITLKINVDGAEKGEVTTNMHATAFRIITVNVQDVSENPDTTHTYQPADPVYSWAPAVAEWVAENYLQYIDTENGNAVTQTYLDFYNTTGRGDAAIAPFIDALAAAIKGRDPQIHFVWDNTLNDGKGGYPESGYEWDNDEGKFKDNGQPLVSSADFGDNNTAVIENLSKGSYIVLVEGGKRIYQPSVANLTPSWREANGGKPAGWYVDTTANLTIKSKPVSVTKTVSDKEEGPFANAANAGIGDTVYFNISADVPQYPANAISTTFEIKDRLSTGLSLTDEDGEEVKLVAVSATNAKKDLTLGNEYTYNADGKPADATFIIKLDYAKVKDYKTIEVTYPARLNRNAVTGSDGNINEAFLGYSNDPYIANSYKETTDESKVYTYGLDLSKVDANDNTKLLPGAVFTLQRKVDGEWKTVKFIEDGAVGNYRRTMSGGTDRIEVGQKGTANEGKLDLRGLDAGEYQLTEVVAPDGYVLLTNAAPFTIRDTVVSDGTAGIDGIPDNGVANNGGNTATNGYVPLSVENSQGFNLPITGGMGTMLFTVCGCILVAGAVVLLMVANRKKSRRS